MKCSGSVRGRNERFPRRGGLRGSNGTFQESLAEETPRLAVLSVAGMADIFLQLLVKVNSHFNLSLQACRVSHYLYRWSDIFLWLTATILLD